MIWDLERGADLELESEFGHVQVELDNSANGSRLMIRDLKTGQTIFLDPLELEGLAWARHGDLAPLLDPGLSIARDSSLDSLQVDTYLREYDVTDEGP